METTFTLDISIIMALIALVGMMVSILTFNSAVKERHARSATDSAQIKAELKTLSAQVKELRDEVKKANEGYHRNSERITTLETRMDAVESRMEGLEASNAS